MIVEEFIISSSYDPDAESGHLSGRTVDLSLIQKTAAGKQTLRILDNRSFTVASYPASGEPSEYEFPVWLLDHRPARTLKPCWKYLIVSLACSVMTGLAGSGVNVPHSAIITPVLGAISGLALAYAIHESHFCLTFCSLHGRIPLVSLINNKPDARVFRAFMNNLIQHIRNDAIAPGPVGSTEALNAELMEHRRLNRIGIITDRQYNAAKTRILDQHQ